MARQVARIDVWRMKTNCIISKITRGELGSRFMFGRTREDALVITNRKTLKLSSNRLEGGKHNRNYNVYGDMDSQVSWNPNMFLEHV
jgi:hypothetical protein